MGGDGEVHEDEVRGGRVEAAEHDVGGAEVPVHDVQFVQGGEGLVQLPYDAVDEHGVGRAGIVVEISGQVGLAVGRCQVVRVAVGPGVAGLGEVGEVAARPVPQQLPHPAVRGVAAVVPLEDVAATVVLDTVDGRLVRLVGAAQHGPQAEPAAQRDGQRSGVPAQVATPVRGLRGRRRGDLVLGGPGRRGGRRRGRLLVFGGRRPCVVRAPPLFGLPGDPVLVVVLVFRGGRLLVRMGHKGHLVNGRALSDSWWRRRRRPGAAGPWIKKAEPRKSEICSSTGELPAALSPAGNGRRETDFLFLGRSLAW
ncbi:hypothetical protein SVIO_015210 [Streptomyces violaceusniger]|uniref:Uncharacterized protein n=1 Tax=Streptomyces violaceusniger TaxID=68280 RepID=A0A4D4KX27_STRVO|nr:hypothetical protein SVIO_015210 [Streptomyces violaceusniger]